MEYLGPNHPHTISLQHVLNNMQGAAKEPASSSKPGLQQAALEAATTPARRLEAPSSDVAREPPCASAQKTKAASPAKTKAASPATSSARGASSKHLAATGHTLNPLQQGQRVAVIGDGWGGGEEGYEAVVTEADNFTFTVVAVSGNNTWTEFHVLRKHCIPLGPLALGPVGAPASASSAASPARKASSAASPKRKASPGKKHQPATPVASPEARRAGAGKKHSSTPKTSPAVQRTGVGKKRQSASATSPAAARAGSGKRSTQATGSGTKKQRTSR